MRTLLDYLLPVAVVIFVGYRLRGTVLVLCAVPLVLSMGEAVFLRTWAWSVKVPFFPYPLSWNDVVFITLVVAWLFARERHPGRRPLRAGPDIVAVLLVLFLVLLEVPLAWALDGAVKVGVVWALRGWLYVPICLAMWVDIFRRSSRDEVHRLLATLAVVSVPLAAMYSLSEVGVPIYPHLGWAPQSVGSATIVRDFLTFPFWAKLGLAWYVTRPKQSPASLLAIAALLMACVLTYTRSIEIPAALCVLVALVLPLATTRNWGVVGRRMMAFAGLTAVAIAGLAILAPGNLAFSYQRIHELARNGENSANVASRVETFSIASRTSYAANGVFGAGASVSGASRVDALWEQGLLLADSLWTFTVIGIGLAGVASFAVLFAVFLWRAVRLCLLGETVSRLGGVMLIVIVWDIIRSPASSEFVTLYPIVSGLFMAVVAIEIRGAWRLVRENTGA